MPVSLIVATILALAAAPPEPPVAQPQGDSFHPDPAWTPLGRSLWFDRKAKRLILRARVVLLEGPLEHLLCLKGTKEHEAILATDAVPRRIHAGLLLTGAEPGHPVQFQPRFAPPSGTPIAIELEWVEGGKTRRADARQWVKGERNDKALAQDWVFAGSELFQDRETKTPVYAADDGDLITVANFSSAILDLPFASTSQDADRIFVANTPRIPPRGTPVTMSLRPRPPSAVRKP
jgi:hypothetical protein